MSEDAGVRRLRWRCRRGMRELDQLLLRYLDAAWPAADETERALFLRLLDHEDDRLWRWFMGREPAPDKELDVLVRRILDLPL
ncbi:succinate dehydrogenase assembly factor 2 [Arenimonas fontis]|uniref:FAD assembly factor SdhE n=1 Tax=Arenimonas fontis TaxID=2608255 RepID=A0A5B2Z955_9GAMM|nr:succinate dehydrogenase assembly factor 2 [Arenimonas fontis]KAA2284435.1 succinate dehydrogenase assembly factor 2 family protein [Arenimonas fontis]